MSGAHVANGVALEMPPKSEPSDAKSIQCLVAHDSDEPLRHMIHQPDVRCSASCELWYLDFITSV